MRRVSSAQLGISFWFFLYSRNCKSRRPETYQTSVFLASAVWAGAFVRKVTRLQQSIFMFSAVSPPSRQPKFSHQGGGRAGQKPLASL